MHMTVYLISCLETRPHVPIAYMHYILAVSWVLLEARLQSSKLQRLSLAIHLLCCLAQLASKRADPNLSQAES